MTAALPSLSEPGPSGAETIARSSRPDVRNPVLKLPAAAALSRLPDEARVALRQILLELAKDSARRAQECWRRHKAPMAVYWKVVSVYSRHIAKAIPVSR